MIPADWAGVLEPFTEDFSTEWPVDTAQGAKSQVVSPVVYLPLLFDPARHNLSVYLNTPSIGHTSVLSTRLPAPVYIHIEPP